MPSDAAENDPRRIWQSQPTTVLAEALERMIERKAEEVRARKRRALWGACVAPVGVACVSALTLHWFDGVILRACCLVAFGWSLVGQYVIHRGIREAGGQASGEETGLHAYRREVRQLQALALRHWLWLFAPIVLALGSLVVLLVRMGLENGMLAKAVPFLTLVAGWVVMVVFGWLRDQRALQRELDALGELERAHRA